MRQRGAAGRLSRAWAWGVLALSPLIVAAWVAAAVLATSALPGLGEGANVALGDVVAEDSRALAVQQASAERFGVPLAADVAVVMRNPRGLSAEELERVAAGARDAATRRLPPELEGVRGAVPLVNVGVGGLRWPERATTAITYLGYEPGANLGTRRRLAEAYAGRYLDPAAGTEVRLTGATPARLAQFDAIEDALPLVTIASVLLVALIVGLHFRSVLAPLVTLVAAGLAYAVSVRVLGWGGQELGVTVPREVEPVVVVLLLGLVTDYSIFFLSGMRAALARGVAPREAMREGTLGTSRIVLTAGLIVAAGTGALVAGELAFFEAFGPGLALCALVSVAVCLTFVPACMALLGRRMFGGLPEPSPAGARAADAPRPATPPPGWVPRRLRARAAVMSAALRLSRDAARREGRSRWRVLGARVLASRPVALPVVVLTVAALAAATVPAGRIDLGVGFTSGLPDDEPVRLGAADAAAGFAPGILGPTELLLEGGDVGRRLDGVVALQAALDRRPGVAATIGPREGLDRLGPGVLVSADGGAARLAVVFDSPPDSAEAIDAVGALAEDLPGLIESAGLDGVDARLGGETALAAETVDAVAADLVRIAIAALLANLLLLALFMRALVAPLYLLAGSVLAFGAGLGATVWVLDLLGQGTALTYFVPLACAVLLVSLGSDYNVFVAGRIWEEARRRRLREAVAVAAPKAAGPITVAGVTLAATFALLALVPLESFRQFALLMVAGVLIDALVVRSILIPGLVSLFGELSWWPGRRVRPAGLADFLEGVGTRAGLGLPAAETAARATLSTLAERIDAPEARAVRQQVPAALQESLEPGRAQDFDADEFVRRVSERAELAPDAARAAAAAVLAALDDVVDATTMAYVRAQLPGYGDLLSVRPPA